MSVKIRTLVLTLVILALARPVYADVGIPPWSMPGSSLNPAGTSTQVQMVSEDVLIVIEAQQRDDVLTLYQGTLAANVMVGRVEAVFVMRNQGDQAEAFDVWFPLWLSEVHADLPLEYLDLAPVDHVVVWVNGAQVPVRYLEAEGQTETLLPWAVWPVSFPSGQDVEIRVTYDVFPVGDRPYGTFFYILETGADWWEAIGEGTITIRLPYPVNETNTALDPDSKGVFWSTAPHPDGYTVSGTDVVWRFTDLEPSADDNVRLTAMEPAVWDEIVAARQEAEANPESALAQLRLAHALADGLEVFKATIVSQGNSAALADDAQAAFRRALSLVPESLQVNDLVRYLELVYWTSEKDIYALPADTLARLTQAVDEHPDQIEPVVRFLRMVYDVWMWTNDGNWHNVPPPAALVALLQKTAEIAPAEAWIWEEWERMVNATPTPSPLPTLTVPPPTPSPLPTLTAPPTTAPVPTLTPIPTSTPPPAPTPVETGGGASTCAASLAAVLGPLGVAWIVQRRSIHASRKS
jgi:hypothetical protein